MAAEPPKQVQFDAGALEGIDPETAALAAEAILTEAAIARDDLSNFFGFVVREETTRRPLVAAPHQRVLFSFVQHHPFCVVRMPAESSKSYCMAAVTMFLLGHDPTVRGAVVSATREQAAKVVSMVGDYITDPDLRAPLQLVFPNLRRTRRPQEPWTQFKITVERPAGIRDPSLVAVGIGGALPGSRLKWVIVDDILSFENTANPDMRNNVFEFFDSTVLSRLDSADSRLVVTNTPWNPDDVTYRLEAAGWPTLTMDVMGNIFIANAADDWDTDDIRPSTKMGEVYRLSAHDLVADENGELVLDYDHDEERTLWELKFSHDKIENLRKNRLQHRFNQLYMCQCRDEMSARCKQEWIDRAKRQGAGLTFVSKYEGNNPTVTGVDLGVGQTEKHDKTVFVTIELLRSGKRRVLDIDIGRWDGPTVVTKLIKKHQAYGSIVRVENNACFAPGSQVLTRGGYVPIEDVRMGDEVWTHKGRWRRVAETIEGKARMFTTVETAGACAVRCTPNHWFWLKEAGRVSGRGGGHHRPFGEPTWVSAGLADRPAYVALAVPSWEPNPAVLELPAILGKKAIDVPVDDDIAIAVGLFMAEGNATIGQVQWTFARHETHLADHVEEMCERVVPGAATLRRNGEGTLRVIVSSTQLARTLKRFGKSMSKRPPQEMFGWPLDARMAIVRGWLLGDGCLRANNAKTRWPRRFFSGASISRNWMLFAQTTLLEAGLRPALRWCKARAVSVINGRTVRRNPIYEMALNAEDSIALSATMVSRAEQIHWDQLSLTGRRSNSHIVHDQHGAWSRLKVKAGGPFEPYGGPVHNLIIEEDESFVVEGMVVHNAQDFIRQFAIAAKASVPVKAHTTGRNKAHSEYGIESLFVELQNGAWIFPCDRRLRCHRNLQELIDNCLYYDPGKHTGDVLMAMWFAREQARKLGDGGRRGGVKPGSLAARFLSR